jgi:hypothetical protein
MRLNFVQLGPAIPVVPIGDFTRMGLSEQQWADAWRLCGPAAEKNLKNLELWQVIAAAYLEGLQHGAETILARQLTTDDAARLMKGREL